MPNNVTKTSPALVQSLRDHARNVRTSILKDGPYPQLFERAADEIDLLRNLLRRSWLKPADSEPDLRCEVMLALNEWPANGPVQP